MNRTLLRLSIPFKEPFTTSSGVGWVGSSSEPSPAASSLAAAWFVGVTPQLAGASFVADPDNPGDAPGDGRSPQPINMVALTIHDALAGQPVMGFTPPSAGIAGK